MSKVVIGLLVVGTAVFGQGVALRPGTWVQNGVVLVPSSSEEFTSLVPDLIPFGAASNVSALFPYSFALRNYSGQTIIAFGVRWTRIDAQGRTRTTDFTWENLSSFSGG